MRNGERHRSLYYLGMIAGQQGNFSAAAHLLEAAATGPAFAKRASLAMQQGHAADSPHVLRWVTKAARLGHKQACGMFMSNPLDDPNQNQGVLINCLFTDGSIKAFEYLLGTVYPTLPTYAHRLHAVRVLRRMAKHNAPRKAWPVISARIQALENSTQEEPSHGRKRRKRRRRRRKPKD